MKTFLLNKEHSPIVKWGLIPDNTFYIGDVPQGYSLALCPTNEKMVIVDIDCKEGKGNGYNNIPKHIFDELLESFHYKTGSGGMHIFLYYTGDKLLKNCATKYSIDLRIGPNRKTGNAGGYVRYQGSKPIQECTHLIKESSETLNKWLEELFS